MLPRPARRPLAVALCAVALPLLTAAGAQAACLPSVTTKAFAKLGDTADYALLSGGNFETGAVGWSLGGASIVAGNESLFVGTTKDARALSVPATAKSVSPVFCVGVEHPTFRFVARKGSGTWATMLVKVRWWDSTGNVNETTLGALDGTKYGAWTATPAIALSTSLPLWQVGQSVSAQLVFDPEDSGGSWLVDDIYIDPLKRS